MKDQISFEEGRLFAKKLDENDKLSPFRDQYFIPKKEIYNELLEWINKIIKTSQSNK
jgi:hypothetical protein